MVDTAWLLSIASFGVGSYAALKGHVITRDNARRDQDIALLKKQTDLFWNMVEQHMTTVLHSPHTPELDALLEKYQAGLPLTQEEKCQLSANLTALINDSDEPQGNRAGAVLLLAALKVDMEIRPHVESAD